MLIANLVEKLLCYAIYEGTDRATTVLGEATLKFETLQPKAMAVLGSLARLEDGLQAIRVVTSLDIVPSYYREDVNRQMR